MTSLVSNPHVIAVCLRRGHHFSKTPSLSIRLLSGLGVEGDGHMGALVQHRYDRRRDPAKPNLRQVHLIPSELFDELRAKGLTIQPGDLGENVTTSGIELAALPTGTRLHLGASAVIELTGLREPCVLMDRFQQGLKAATQDRDANGRAVYKAGVMAIVVSDGEVVPGDAIETVLPEGKQRPLEPV
ncbi:MOSC domain-containing protein [Tardiphaga sp. 709]|uniref:MOSC domain-containing protein n=1 Tax=Tardiphaga sp. 709 TaxID=3076039 RepID=UPI0028E880FD|nr:MOSC domain-containing protein [Tardiphaga sp. 709]WNV10926.1 MOSC domain-containing protein [Tardiphaga sp. 709]